MLMKLRPCEKKDLSILAELFRSAVWTLNARDYSQEQIEAWAPDSIDLNSPAWQSLLTTTAMIAERETQIVGFANMTDLGYLDFFYVHPTHVRKGVGKALYFALEKIALEKGLKRLTTSSSLTARPFFESLGFKFVREEVVKRRDVAIKRLQMEKLIS